MGGAFSGLLRAATEAVQVRTEQIRARAPHAQAAAAATPAATPDTTVVAASAHASGGQRRSLVAAKMYIVDMLQLQRHPDAVELKARIQFTSGQAELLDAILAGMRVLVQLANESDGQRVVSRLGEVLPEQCLPALERAVASLRASPTGTPQLKLVAS